MLPYVPGWDCHGLPIELNVEKKHGKRSELVQNKKKCFKRPARNMPLLKSRVKKKILLDWVYWGEWDNPYKSLDSSFEANAVRALGRIYEAGHIEKGEKPVHLVPRLWICSC